MSRTVKVTAPLRLHFGMFSLGNADVKRFGGVGVMIDRPGIEVLFRSSDRLEAHGRLSERTYQFACRAAQSWSLDELPHCRIDVTSAPREHTGLGVGTQLGLSVTAGLNAYLGRKEMPPDALAQGAGRGRRSAVGTYGFVRGGMIVEAGKTEATNPDEIAPLVAHVPLPTVWRFVLVDSSSQVGLSGLAEADVFAGLPPVPKETTSTLYDLALNYLLPAAQQEDFDGFSQNLYRYGVLAGSCFAARQGGPFATPRLAALVDTIRTMGVSGVGQSSWGPTIFALLPDENHAAEFVQQFRCGEEESDLKLSITPPNRGGAQIEVNDFEP